MALDLQKIQVTKSLEGILNNVPDAEKFDFVEHIAEGINFYLAQYEKGIQDGDNKFSLLMAFYNLVDKSIAERIEKSKLTVSCKNGCSYCCNIKVDVSMIEAELVKDFADHMGIDYDRNVLREQADKNEMERMRMQNSACVFLDTDGSCKVYEARPFACRKYFVISPAEQCNIKTNPTGQVTAVADDNAEIIVSMYANLKDQPQGCFSKLLLDLDKNVNNAEATDTTGN